MKRYRFLFLLLAALSMTSCLDEPPKVELMRVRASRAPAVAFTIIIR